jgi:hypothetical protein
MGAEVTDNSELGLSIRDHDLGGAIQDSEEHTRGTIKYGKARNYEKYHYFAVKISSGSIRKIEENLGYEFVEPIGELADYYLFRSAIAVPLTTRHIEKRFLNEGAEWVELQVPKKRLFKRGYIQDESCETNNNICAGY